MKYLTPILMVAVVFMLLLVAYVAVYQAANPIPHQGECVDSIWYGHLFWGECPNIFP
jgi:hypothetical protein